MKRMLVLVASSDIDENEVNNITSQINMYSMEFDRFEINNEEELKTALNNGASYDYVYLATHGCDTHFGNISNTLSITWIRFAALICSSECYNHGAIFLHSCCRGGLSQVAYKMFKCCDMIQFVCGPRNNIFPADLVTSFNLFLFHVEIRGLDPVVAAEKVKSAIDIRLVCYDRLDVEIQPAYNQHCELIQEEVNMAFDDL